MRRLWMVIEYDGSHFHGWQSQEDMVTVQGVIEGAITQLWKENIRLVVAGRTDTGVHSRGQVAHFDMEREIDTFAMMMGINHSVRERGCVVVALGEATGEFHARFDAKYRVYEYRLLNRKASSALNYRHVWHCPQRLDIDIMKKGAAYLEGFHDFSSFRGAGCQAKRVEKHLDVCRVTRHGDELRFGFISRSFLYHQVRIMVGTLVELGRGRRDLQWLEEVIQEKSRNKAGPTAPARGLVLRHVLYHTKEDLETLFSVDKTLLPF